MALIIEKVVRSGQQIYVPDGDVVIMNKVQSGAEIIADGCVHIYAPCFGRVMAGAQGATDARIFCFQFEPELVAIGNQFVTAEEVPGDAWGGQVQIYRVDDKLFVANLKTRRARVLPFRRKHGVPRVALPVPPVAAVAMG